MRAKTLDARDRVLVLGSDGIFDFVGSQARENVPSPSAENVPSLSL